MDSRDLPPQLTMSVGGESVAFTAQAEGSRMSLDEAVASGLFDLPDAPGMTRIPVSITVMIPGHLLQPPAAPAEPDPRRRRRTSPAMAERVTASFGDRLRPPD